MWKGSEKSVGGLLTLILLVYAIIAGVIVSYTDESNRILFIKKWATVSCIPFVGTVVFISVLNVALIVAVTWIAIAFFAVVFAIAAGVSALLNKTLFHFVLTYICVFMLSSSLLVVLLFGVMVFAAIW